MLDQALQAHAQFLPRFAGALLHSCIEATTAWTSHSHFHSDQIEKEAPVYREPSEAVYL